MWSKQDVQVLISSEELTDANSFSSFFQKTLTLGSVDGVYIAAESLLKHTMVTTLDMIVRMLFPSIK